MNKLICLAALLLISFVACGKKPGSTPAEAAAPKTAVSVQADAASPPPPAPGQQAVQEAPPPPDPNNQIKDNLPTAPNDSGLAPGAAHRQLTEALHRYLEAKNTLPTTFEQLVAAKFIDKMPPAPAGKKFAIDRRNMQVVLVDK